MAAHLKYLLITVKLVALEKVSFTLPAHDKHYLLKRDKLAQVIQMQLSQKRKTFPEFFFFYAFLKYILNFKHLPKKDDPHS